MLRKTIFTLLLVLTSTQLFADGDISNRKIINIGCHHVDAICYVTLSGEPFGNNLNCAYKNINQFRFEANNVNGRRTYASLYAAYLSKKLVSVYLEGCSPDGRPSISYYSIT